LDHTLQEIDAAFLSGFQMRVCQESGSREDVDRADVLVVSQGGFRRAHNPLPQFVLTIRMQIFTPYSFLQEKPIT
jgi:hypothetical protein